jgi:hypothetical protein
VDPKKDMIGIKELEEAIDLFTGYMTRWTLRDVEISNGSLLVSYWATVLGCRTYIFKMVYPSMDYYTVRTAPLPVLLISI